MAKRETTNIGSSNNKSYSNSNKNNPPTVPNNQSHAHLLELNKKIGDEQVHGIYSILKGVGLQELCSRFQQNNILCY